MGPFVGGVDGAAAKFPCVGAFRVPSVGKSVGGTGVAGDTLADFLADAFVCRGGGGESAAVLFDGVEGGVHPVDQEGLHSEHVSVPNGMGAKSEPVKRGAVKGIDVEESSAYPPGDRASTIVLNRVPVLEAAAESAGLDLLLVSFGGPSVENGAEDGASNAWRGEVGEFGEEFGGPVGLPGRSVFPHIG